MPIYKMNGRRDGKQKYRVRINFIDALGKARQVDRVTYGSDEAKILELKLLQEIRHETPAKRMTLRELFKEYCEVRKNEVRESTLDKFKRIMEYHIMPELENIKLEKLDTRLLAQWKLSMENKDISLHTKQAAFSVFRALLNYAVKMEYISKNPLVRVGNFKSSGEMKKEMDFYTAEEFKKFISVARQNAQEAEKRGFLSEWDYFTQGSGRAKYMVCNGVTSARGICRSSGASLRSSRAATGKRLLKTPHPFAPCKCQSH